jgi:hypothetical protein
MGGLFWLSEASFAEIELGALMVAARWHKRSWERLHGHGT